MIEDPSRLCHQIHEGVEETDCIGSVADPMINDEGERQDRSNSQFSSRKARMDPTALAS